jgi:hypothetical protein
MNTISSTIVNISYGKEKVKVDMQPARMKEINKIQDKLFMA